MVAGAWLGACDGDEESETTSNPCALRTTGLSGEAPSCTNSLECGSDEWELACDGAGTGECTCSRNGVVEQTIYYDDRFCPIDFGTADFDAHAAAAREACGWP
jgi:hypothetical protein